MKKLFGLPAKYTIGTFLVLFLGLIVYLNTATMSSESLAAMDSRQQSAEQAVIAKKTSDISLISDCQARLQQTLKNPKSLEFNYSSDYINRRANDIVVQFPYLAENSFGALTQGFAECVYNLGGEIQSIKSA